MNKLEQLRKMTKIVADTGDFEAMKKYTPQDATTNPSLILEAIQKSEYQHLAKNAIDYCQKKARSSQEMDDLLVNKLLVNFGVEILKIVPGRVSTEVDAHLSFDMDKSIAKAKHFIQLYEEMGIPRERVLIKLASTWEGAKAAKVLEELGIHCNMTLLFSLEQAVKCIEAKATLLSPFVGRILDWYKKHEGKDSYPPAEDPGVKSVKTIYNYLKKFGYSTQIMGASFRNVDEVLELAGCDYLTVSPKFLEELQKAEGHVERKLDPEKAKNEKIEKLSFTESEFRYALNKNAMATDKLSEGIRKFAEDGEKLKALLKRQYK